MKKKVEAPVSIEQLLQEAINKPGIMLEASRAFYGYSFMNQMLAYVQCMERDIPLGPIATFKSWKDRGRNVKKGAKALILCLLRTVKREDDNGEQTGDVFTYFYHARKWFALSQTEGDEIVIPDLPTWSVDTALAELDIKRIFFDVAESGLGYAIHRNIAISPLAVDNRNSILFHEVAHIVLGHTAEGKRSDVGTRTSRALREVEAEAVSMCLLELNELDGAAECRHYIQGWFKRVDSDTLPADSARKIMVAVNQIMQAGQKKPEKEIA